MTGVTYEIGNKEKHLLEVDRSMWSGKIKLVLDGKELTGDETLGDKRKLEFEIGNVEKHRVELDVARYGNAFELRVDGKAKVSGGLSV